MTPSSPAPRRSASARPPAKLLTVHQAAEMLSVCDKTVRRLITSEALRSLRVGRAIRISEDDLNLYLATCR